MVELYPPIDPHQQGLLDVGDGNSIFWEVSGNPKGMPAVLLHGGPGQGCSPNMRRAFDPVKYRIVLFDQRGCGQSTPHASDLSTQMSLNTTAHLITDIEALREHLGIQKWLVTGASWGTALALAYGQRHPSRVSAMVLSSVTCFLPREEKWLYWGARRFFSEAFQRFRGFVPQARTWKEVIAAYCDACEDPILDRRIAAAREWCAWEDAVLSLEPGASQFSFANCPEKDLLAFVRICTHYIRHAAWLEDGALIAGAPVLAGIPGVLIHGRRDMSCPIDTAWLLSRYWPGSKLVALDDAGHLGTDAKRLALLRALDSFAM